MDDFPSANYSECLIDLTNGLHNTSLNPPRLESLIQEANEEAKYNTKTSVSPNINSSIGYIYPNDDTFNSSLGFKDYWKFKNNNHHAQEQSQQNSQSYNTQYNNNLTASHINSTKCNVTQTANSITYGGEEEEKYITQVSAPVPLEPITKTKHVKKNNRTLEKIKNNSNTLLSAPDSKGKVLSSFAPIIDEHITARSKNKEDSMSTPHLKNSTAVLTTCIIEEQDDDDNDSILPSPVTDNNKTNYFIPLNGSIHLSKKIEQQDKEATTTEIKLQNDTLDTNYSSTKYNKEQVYSNNISQQKTSFPSDTLVQKCTVSNSKPPTTTLPLNSTFSGIDIEKDNNIINYPSIQKYDGTSCKMISTAPTTTATTQHSVCSFPIIQSTTPPTSITNNHTSSMIPPTTTGPIKQYYHRSPLTREIPIISHYNASSQMNSNSQYHLQASCYIPKTTMNTPSNDLTATFNNNDNNKMDITKIQSFSDNYWSLTNVPSREREIAFPYKTITDSQKHNVTTSPLQFLQQPQATTTTVGLSSSNVAAASLPIRNNFVMRQVSAPPKPTNIPLSHYGTSFGNINKNDNIYRLELDYSNPISTSATCHKELSLFRKSLNNGDETNNNNNQRRQITIPVRATDGTVINCKATIEPNRPLIDDNNYSYTKSASIPYNNNTTSTPYQPVTFLNRNALQNRNRPFRTVGARDIQQRLNYKPFIPLHFNRLNNNNNTINGNEIYNSNEALTTNCHPQQQQQQQQYTFSYPSPTSVGLYPNITSPGGGVLNNNYENGNNYYVDENYHYNDCISVIYSEDYDHSSLTSIYNRKEPNVIDQLEQKIEATFPDWRSRKQSFQRRNRLRKHHRKNKCGC